MKDVIPVVIFAHSRADHLVSTLASLKRNHIPLLYVFADGPRSLEEKGKVDATRSLLRAIDWCEVKLVERERNWGLGKSIMGGVGEVLQSHDAAIIFEDDLICLPGTYDYLSSALRHYRNNENVMSVTGWTHPRLTPTGIKAAPYFDGRSECWVWGTWARAWRGMEQSAEQLLESCKAHGIDIYKYGSDLPAQARNEQKRNLWAVRWLYLHMLRGGLCLRPPWSMVEHIGFDASASNAVDAALAQSLCASSPPVPPVWPPVKENDACGRLWQKECGGRPFSLPWTRVILSRLGAWMWRLALATWRRR